MSTSSNAPHYPVTYNPESPPYRGTPHNVNYGNVHNLMHAARTGNTQTIRRVVDDGTSVNARNRLGETALMHASRAGHISTVRALLNMGATTPPGLLHTIAGSRHVDIVRLLVTHGQMNVNARDDHGQTPLHRAAMYGRAGTVTYLINHGAKIHAKDHTGRTPLHIAVRCGEFPGTVRALLDAGARVNIKDNQGIMPLGTDTTNTIRNMMIMHTNFRKKLHNDANGIDPITYDKVPLRDARVVLNNMVNGQIRHIFHKNTINQMRRHGHLTQPMTRRHLDIDNVVPLENIIDTQEKNVYRRLRNNTTARNIRRNNVIVISNSNSNSQNRKRRRTRR